MKTTKPKASVKKPTKICDEIGNINSRIDNTWDLIEQAEESIRLLAERQQIMLYGIVLATIIAATDFIWLCTK